MTADQRHHGRHHQAGVILVLFAMTLPVLLGLIALAIDCGNLYLSRARLTKIVRSSSATALNMMALRGWGSLVADPVPATSGPDMGLRTYNAKINPPDVTNANQAVIQEVQHATMAALAQYFPRDFEGLTPSQSPEYLRFKLPGETETTSSVTLSSLDLTDSSIRLVIRYAAPTYLLGAVSQMFGIATICEKMGTEQTTRCWVESATPPDGKAGKMRRAHVMMLLDVSGSMNEQTNGKTKAAALFEAASHFLDMFNPRNDRFSIIPYATSADTGTAPTLSSLDNSAGNGPAEYLPIKSSISALEVGGQTNPCDALIQVIRTVQADSDLADPQTPKFVVLFTDGAPNVYRLSFCESAGATDSTCSGTPSLLQTALGSSNADADYPGWYGWTVKWDKREVFPLTYPSPATCPEDGSGERSPNGSDIPACDPFWAFPRLIDNATNSELAYDTVSQYLRLREDGEFVFKGGTYGSVGRAIAELGYSLKFKDWLGTDLMRRDYQYPDAFKWHGPSYLVHAGFRIPRGVSLIDRIPQSLESEVGMTPAITCGPGSRPNYPGSLTKFSPIVADKYNHSRYFASRVLDVGWRYNGSINEDSEDKADKTELTRDQLHNSPAYFDQPHTLIGNPHDSPGCLTTLRAKIPFTNEQINVGDNFVSNNRDSIPSVGEVVKTAELPYYCALRAADYLRSQYGVVIFVVGLGESATTLYGPDCQDPLQNPLDPNSRKDRFLRRLAFAPESLADPISFINHDPSEIPLGAQWHSDTDFRFRTGVSFSQCTGTVSHPLSGSSAIMEVGYGERLGDTPIGFTPSDHNFTPSHLGAYYAAEDPDALKMIFGDIAKRVLLRLAT